MMLENTISEFKQAHETLVTQGNEEDIYNIFIKGENKFQLEVDAAMRISSPKYLLNIIGASEEPKDREEIIEIDYDKKNFY